ncbi:MAG: SGNH/GDSL hydrolase family protein [Alphaproteobacteria bacterium]|nr:SGNH/GDSL hydrolase family protein [Alphaproteobacteria bacterium]
MSYKIIAALGDSITNGYWDSNFSGWFGRLAARLSLERPQAFGFNNCSQNGDRICDAFHRFGAEVMTREVDILLIAIGLNDLIRSSEADSPLDLSPHLRAEYWNRLLDAAAKNCGRVVVFDILPVRENMMPCTEGNGLTMFWKNSDIVEYNDQIAELCASRGIPFVRRYHRWIERDLAHYYFDEAHPNEAGHTLLAEKVYKELTTLGVI